MGANNADRPGQYKLYIGANGLPAQHVPKNMPVSPAADILSRDGHLAPVSGASRLTEDQIEAWMRLQERVIDSMDNTVSPSSDRPQGKTEQ